jgi:hypothetical protein
MGERETIFKDRNWLTALSNALHSVSALQLFIYNISPNARLMDCRSGILSEAALAHRTRLKGSSDNSAQR